MLACTGDPTRSLPIHLVRDGAASRDLWRRDGAIAAATMMGVLPRRWRRFDDGGGVLEHPAYSDAWAAFDLPRPFPSGWQRGLCGGWSCHVNQGAYGHVAKKATWLYAYGADLPDLLWGAEPDRDSRALVSWCGNRTKAHDARPRVGRKAASATPEAFRHVLISVARSCAGQITD